MSRLNLLAFIFAHDTPHLKNPYLQPGRNVCASTSPCYIASEGVDSCSQFVHLLRILNAFTTLRTTAFLPDTAFAVRPEETPPGFSVPSPLGPPIEGFELVWHLQDPAVFELLRLTIYLAHRMHLFRTPIGRRCPISTSFTYVSLPPLNTRPRTRKAFLATRTWGVSHARN